MSFFEEFCRAFQLSPLQALTALYWHLMRRRVRSRNILRKISAHAPYVYEMWLRTVENLAGLSTKAPTAIAQWVDHPSFSLIVAVEPGTSADHLHACVDAVRSQFYGKWELLLVAPPDQVREPHDDQPGIKWVESQGASDVSALKAGIVAAKGDFVFPITIGARLSSAALYRFAEALQAHPEAAILYGDQDRMDAYGRRTTPWFKPSWNHELFLAQDYLSFAYVIRTTLARTAFLSEEVAGAGSYALALEAVSQAAERIVHVPHIVCHLAADSDEASILARLSAVSRHVSPFGATAEEGQFGAILLRWPLPKSPPLVSIIIPTRDKVDLLRTCIESLISRTTYPYYEILIIDNQSVEPVTLDYFSQIGADPRIRILSYDAEFNFSEMNNMAVEQASGAYICLLNNDIEVVEPEWLCEMMRYAVRDNVGAVGAKLLYPDGSIQHAGVVVGIGGAAGHAHRFLPAEQRGYFDRAHVAHYVSAVTAACLVVEKRKFQLVGGLDAEHFQVAFNDVDFCLKLEQAGWRNVYVPQAALIHYESKSRGSDMLPKNLDRYLRELGALQRRWGTQDYRDPLHHPHLDRANETYVIHL